MNARVTAKRFGVTRGIIHGKEMGMAFGWLNWVTGVSRKRKQQLLQIARHALPNYVPQWHDLSESQRQKLQKWTVDFCERKNWEGCNGLTLSDEMQLIISARAGLLVVGWSTPFYFPDVRTILVYPDHFVAPHRMSIGSGLHIESRAHLEGQAWYRGPVIISWEDVINPDRDTPHNIVIHEFAHQLDMLNGGNADGIPPLPESSVKAWQAVMTAAMDELKSKCESPMTIYPSILDCYGCESPAEFFAVSSEAYFEAPVELEEEQPDWYRLLDAFYRP